MAADAWGLGRVGGLAQLLQTAANVPAKEFYTNDLFLLKKNQDV